MGRFFFVQYISQVLYVLCFTWPRNHVSVYRTIGPLVYLYVNGSGSITSVGEERANLSAVVYLYLCGFCLERFPLHLGALDGLRY